MAARECAVEEWCVKASRAVDRATLSAWLHYGCRLVGRASEGGVVSNAMAQTDEWY